jgi:ABC-type nitrate/sulfonate/bicarbonate transport system ATPase subunit
MHDHISRFPESGHFMTGSVLWKNLPLTGPIREFGYVPQHYSGTLLRGKTALDNVLLAVKEDGISPEERERAESLMTHSGIWEQKDSKIEHLSGGQQQRVAICRALITQPGVVFMDEPFANLDDSLKPGMSRLLRDFMTELHLKLSVLLVTHDKRHAHEISNEIVELTERHGMPSSNVQSMRGPRHD